jgi:hypothetical protein
MGTCGCPVLPGDGLKTVQTVHARENVLQFRGDHAEEGGMELTMNLRNIITEVWESLLGRFVIIGLAVGWVPFVLLSMAHNALAR